MAPLAHVGKHARAAQNATTATVGARIA